MAEGACDCAGNTPDIDGNCQDCLSDTDGDGLYDDICGPCLGETSITYNGVVYGLLEIGGKCWFKENLRTTSYNSGTPILYTPDEAEWNDLGDSGGYSVYDNDNANTSIYGLLYNGYASVSPEEICPTYYNVPTLEEWDALIAELGGEEVAGGAMKESGLDHWASPNTGATNSSGFTALPGGGRSVGSAGYLGQTLSAEFWAKGQYTAPVDQVANYIQAITISNTSASIVDISHSSVRGHSIRCLRADVLLGCTDFNFMEYNPDANADDGSCAVPAVHGCMDPLFVEYDPLANVDDGSWCNNLIGCEDGDVVDYNGYTYPVVTIGNQCWFQENLRTESYRNGDAIPNIQDDGEWLNLKLTETGAWSDYYNDESLGEIYGKLYNFYAVDDLRALCPSDWHVASEPEWTELIDLYGGTLYAGEALKSSVGWYNNGNGTNSSGFTALPGGYRYYAFNSYYYHSESGYWWTSTEKDSDEAYWKGLHFHISDVSSGDPPMYYGLYVRCLKDACNGQGMPEGDCDCNGNQLDVLGVCGGMCYADDDGNGVCDDAEILGCIDETNACNYNPLATQDDGSCGVIDALGVCGGDCFAGDADGDEICDDIDDCVGTLDVCGVCNGSGAVYECGCTDIPEGDCDCNGNQIDVLGECGGTCSADEDGDGVCDDIDDCVGDLDACGVCNGPGDVYECGCSEMPAEDCDCARNQEDVFGVCGGGCLADDDGDLVCDDIDDCVGEYDECGECNGDGSSCAFATCGDDLLYEGHVYGTVEIGGQCWFAENCRYLPSVSPSSSFDNSTPYYYVYGYEGSDVTSAQSEANYDTYGALYNWSAIMQPGICPSGWHIPSDAEWSQLTTSLGGASVAGEAMKSTSGWNNSGNGSNSSGFNALPAGIQAGNFSSLGSTGYWWSSSAYSSTQAWYRYISESNDAVNSAHPFKRNGCSARCVID